MMREWDVAGRCCAGRGWWCGVDFFGIMGFTHPQVTLVNSMRLAKKKIMLFGVYAGMILFPRIFQF